MRDSFQRLMFYHRKNFWLVKQGFYLSFIVRVAQVSLNLDLFLQMFYVSASLSMVFVLCRYSWYLFVFEIATFKKKMKRTVVKNHPYLDAPFKNRLMGRQSLYQ